MSTSPTRTRLTAEARRRAVLDAAIRVFGRSSYRGATTAEIAREAGISEPILYRHFGSKRDLYLACMAEALTQFRSVADVTLEADPDGCLGAIMDAYMSTHNRLRLVDLWLQALNEASGDTVIAAAVREQIREVHRFVVEVIERGQAARTIDAQRDAIAEAWIFVAGGLLVTIDHRLGGLVGNDLERVRAARRDWLRTSTKT